MLTLRIWFLALDRVARLDDAVTEHRELLQAICDGDAVAGRGRHAPPHRRLRASDPRRALTATDDSTTTPMQETTP